MHKALHLAFVIYLMALPFSEKKKIKSLDPNNKSTLESIEQSTSLHLYFQTLTNVLQAMEDAGTPVRTLWEVLPVNVTRVTDLTTDSLVTVSHVLEMIQNMQIHAISRSKVFEKVASKKGCQPYY